MKTWRIPQIAVNVTIAQPKPKLFSMYRFTDNRWTRVSGHNYTYDAAVTVFGDRMVTELLQRKRVALREVKDSEFVYNQAR